MDAPAPGGLGGTYGGSPMGIAAANAVLDVIEEEGLATAPTSWARDSSSTSNRCAATFPRSWTSAAPAS